MEKIYILKFDEKFIKNYDENSEKVYILEQMLNILKLFTRKNENLLAIEMKNE